jgi:hypothetical protein
MQPARRLSVVQFGCRSDNYGFLLRDEQAGLTAAIDTPDAKAIQSACSARGWTVSCASARLRPLSTPTGASARCSNPTTDLHVVTLALALAPRAISSRTFSTRTTTTTTPAGTSS